LNSTGREGTAKEKEQRGRKGNSWVGKRTAQEKKKS
jgi:hypothetical protein